MKADQETTRPLLDPHRLFIGYLLWIFGFFGAHRFFYGKQITGTLYFFTLGILFIGWIIDLFLIPGMKRETDIRYVDGPKDYSLAWILLTFLGPLGIHRMYLGKWFTGILYLLTLGFLGIGIIWDYWTLNGQIDSINSAAKPPLPPLPPLPPARSL